MPIMTKYNFSHGQVLTNVSFSIWAYLASEDNKASNVHVTDLQGEIAPMLNLCCEMMNSLQSVSFNISYSVQCMICVFYLCT